MDLDKLTTGDKVIGISAIVFFIALFLPWYGKDFGVVSVNRSGFDYFLFGILPLLLILAVVGLVVLLRLVDNVDLPDLPITWAQAMLIAAGLAAALVLLKLLLGDDPGGFGLAELDRKFGIFIGLLAALGVVAGSFLNMQADTGTARPGGGTAPPQPF